MKRAMIIGGSGSGKSTLARLLGEISNLPVVHIDPMYWKPRWVQRTSDETHALVLEAASKDIWVFDGNHSRSIPDRMARADHFIFLDLPTYLRLWRVLNRTIRYLGRPRPDMADGCPERFNWEFLTVWVAGYHRRSHARDIAVLNSAPDHVKCYHLKSRKEVRQFLTDMEAKYEQT